MDARTATVRHRSARWPGPVAALAVVLAAGVLLVGCGNSQDARARKLMKEGNERLENAAAEIKDLAGFDGQWRLLVEEGAGKEAAETVTRMLVKAQETERRALEETRAAGELYDRALELEISAELREYGEIRRRAIREQEMLLEAELEAMEERIAASRGQEAGEPLERVMEADRRIDELEAESRRHAAEAAKLYEQANDYYEEHGIGK